MSVEIAISRATGTPGWPASRLHAARIPEGCVEAIVGSNLSAGNWSCESGEAELITDGGPAAIAAKKATAVVPIVIGAATSKFLERQRLIAGLARLGGKHHGLYHLHSPHPSSLRILDIAEL
jgi:hypothetical protein